MEQQKIDLELDNNTWDWTNLERFLSVENDKKLIQRAWKFGSLAHLGQKRQSGADYFSHPVWIAKVVAQLNLGDEAICAALLHDTVEDTSITIEKIAGEFGDEVALLVAGLTDVKQKTKKISIHSENIEVFKNFLLSSVNDVRVLIIRLVDKLHNGLTIGAMPKEKQIRYSQRVLHIYAPVAEYVGLHFFKKKLEDLAFEVGYPKEAFETKKMLANLKGKEDIVLEKVKINIESLLTTNHIPVFEIRTRVKGIYSTFKKSKNKFRINPLKDRIGIRVLVPNISICYNLLGLLHAQYKYIEDEFDDYISNPKVNGYRSLQTTLLWNGWQIEVQIRTFEMHDFNEFGPASHIAYKAREGKEKSLDYDWVRQLVAWEKDEGIKNYRISVLKNFIYVFTPKGDVVQLPKDSTALDFAYYIHMDIGNRCIGAKINQKMGKISDVLQNGDHIEIFVGSKPNVNRDWLLIAKSKKALEQIRKGFAIHDE